MRYARYKESNVKAVAINDEMMKYTIARDRALTKCYAMDGYEKLPLAEKNKIYDSVIKEIKAEMNLR